MADNYIENKMDDYRSGRLAPKSKPQTRAYPSDALVLRYPQLRTLILVDNFQLLEALATAFRHVNCKVAFTWPEDKCATAIAQRLGLRYYPFDPVKLQTQDFDTWGGLDLIVAQDAILDKLSKLCGQNALIEGKRIIVLGSEPNTQPLASTTFCVNIDTLSADHMNSLANYVLITAYHTAYHPKIVTFG